MERVAEMRRKGNVIPIYMEGIGEQYVCYDDSNILILLSRYPYIQLCVVLLFLVLCIVAVVSSKRAEQNRVWVGLSKETAHQLGTPISSLMAWLEILKEKYPEDELLPDMGHDVERLQRVAERFSKIGSNPEHTTEDIVSVIEQAVEYVKRRSPSKVEYVVDFPKRPILVRMNAPLIEWVMENVCKNAVDAMNGAGNITITVSQDNDKAFVDIADTGKGIAKSCHKRVFEPGYTTKKRGWGLGLSLAKRIVEQYHKGRIFVKSSVVGRGTTIRLELRK
jgi:signal transduction histidine kinase